MKDKFIPKYLTQDVLLNELGMASSAHEPRQDNPLNLTMIRHGLYLIYTKA